MSGDEEQIRHWGAVTTTSVGEGLGEGGKNLPVGGIFITVTPASFRVSQTTAFRLHWCASSRQRLIAAPEKEPL
jgi:hypothetical protein